GFTLAHDRVTGKLHMVRTWSGKPAVQRNNACSTWTCHSPDGSPLNDDSVGQAMRVALRYACAPCAPPRLAAATDDPRKEPATARTRDPHRPARPHDLCRLPAAGQAAVGPEAAVRPCAPRRDAVHHPAPGVGAVAEAADARAAGRARAPAAGPGLAVPQGDGPRQAGAPPAGRAVVGAGDEDAFGIHGLPRPAGPVLR